MRLHYLDLLALKQVMIPFFFGHPVDLIYDTQICRVLHAFGSTDYIWQQLKIDLPLNIPPDVDINSLSGVELQQIVIDALRLEHNWRKPVSQVN
jgi:hypothetical protein